jgi:site-specific DNA-methyltransferase (adenine-specific)
MSNDLVVVKVDQARRLLAEARDAGQAKRVADVARAVEVYAKRQKLSEEAIAYATTVRVDAMTLLGEFLRAAPKNKGAKGNPGGRGARIVQSPSGTTQSPTLAEAGISKKESSDAQALADLKENEAILYEDVRSGKMSVPRARSAARRKQKLARMEQRANGRAKADDDSCRVITGDCLTELPRLPAGSVRLAFADPPYNIGVNYGEGTRADQLPRPEYLQWCRSWMQAVARLLTPDGSCWVLINDESAARFQVMLEEVGLSLRQWLIWYESFGVNNANGFNRTHRHLFWTVKDPRKFVFNSEAVNRPSDRQAKYDDRRADPAGKTWDSVWGINPPVPRLTGTCAERVPEFPTQLPLALLRPIVGCASDAGDLVLDPFSGSGTTGVACRELGRRYIGIERSARYADLSRQRLKTI